MYHSTSTDAVPLRSAMKHHSSSRSSTPPTSSTSPLVYSSTLPSSTSISSPTPGSLFSPIASPPSFPASISTSPTNTLHAPTPVGGYRPKVSFDTFENPAASMFSFTLQVHSDGYTRTKDTRTYLCAASVDDSGKNALEWTIENLLQDGDELVVFRGFDADVLEKDHDIIRAEAREYIRRIQEKCYDADPDRRVSITLEFIAGKVTQTIDRLIALYRPDSLIVGTRGPRGMIQAMSSKFGATAVGGVSKYCLSHSPVPVIVVRPESKVRKTMEKRRANPKRGTHFDDGSLRLRQAQSRVSAVPMSPSVSPSTTRG
ncbi:unnamed protein product [Peniophora sp. CBMAI 1063]|nr:unnamed protein product [Peniophora sp. CBMAI 1063]